MKLLLESNTFQELCEWDSQHGEVEKFNKGNREHLGGFNPDTGEQTRPADPTRRIEK